MKNSRGRSRSVWAYGLPLAACAAALVLSAACSLGGDDGSAPRKKSSTTGATVDGGLTDPPPPSPKTPTPGVYVRGDLSPQYELTPIALYGQFQVLGTNVGAGNLQGVSDSDFGSPSLSVATSQASMMATIAAQIQADDALAAPPALILPQDQNRAKQIPFRGKPSDVKALVVNGQRKLYAAMGGSFEAPGNQIAVLTDTNDVLANPTNVTVGVKPEHLAVHPDNLVFVCNQFSNYISILDPRTDKPFVGAGNVVEIPTEYFCSDIVFAPVDPLAPNPDDQLMFVANRWRHSIIKYHLHVDRDGAGDPTAVTVLDPPNGDAKQAFAGVETTGVGPNPRRLALSESQTEVYVANGAGGALARVTIGGPARADTVAALVSLGATSMDVVNVGGVVYVPSSMVDRGLLVGTGQTNPPQVVAPPVMGPGLDGQPHVVNKGSLFDNTVAYNFEDVRNGLVQLDARLGNANSAYYTDDVSPEPSYQPPQKILAGGLGMSVVRNQAGTAIYVANAGNDQIQELLVDTHTQTVPYSLTAGRTFATQGRIPFGLTIDETAGAKGQLYVTDWGSETVEVVDLAQGKVITTQPLAYAQPTYPATNVERGELWFVNETWSNNGRKSCASCHEDWQWGGDSLSFDNGAAAPTTEHRVKMNANIADTGAYFWNGSFSDNNYASVAFDAQTKDNCRLIEFGIVEGPGSSPATRVGDPKNVSANATLDPGCRPVEANPPIPGFVANEAAIDANAKQEEAVIAQHIQTVTGTLSVTQNGVTTPLDAAQAREEVNREIDIYTTANLRLPPNPQAYLYQAPVPGVAGSSTQLSDTDAASIANGKKLFSSAGCAGCHSPTTLDPLGFPDYADNKNHGPGADWNARFVNAYSNDPRMTDPNTTFFEENGLTVSGMAGGIPAVMTQTLQYNSYLGNAINDYADRIDYFIPFCFDTTNCLEFDDPLLVMTGHDPNNPNFAEESRRLAMVVKFNLGNPDRQFIPGSLVGGPTDIQSNTASLRGVWTQANYLHTGYARSIREAVLAPGHPALLPGETGYAQDAAQHNDVHGATSKLSATDIEDLIQFVQTIQ